MNKKFIIGLSLAFFIFLILTGVALGGAMYFTGRTAIEKDTEKIHQAYLAEIISNFRNDILSGNFRFFRNQISLLIEHGLFSEYALIERGQIVDSTDNYKTKSADADLFITVQIPIWFDTDHISKWGDVSLVIPLENDSQFQTSIAKTFKYMIIVGAVIVVIFFLLLVYWWHRFNSTLDKEITGVIEGKNLSNERRNLVFSLWQPALETLRVKMNEREIAQKRARELEKATILIEISRQVAHDIRSPISALNMVAATVQGLTEQHRNIIRNATDRINGFANDLLKRSRQPMFSAYTDDNLLVEANARQGKIPFFSSLENVESILVLPVVTALIEEKQVANMDKLDLKIQFDQRGCEDVHIHFSDRELQRILSNLINNSIEAIPSFKGKITVSLRLFQDRLQISVADTGQGIPPEILEKLGAPGLSYGKNELSENGSGSGLGVAHAKSTVENAGGQFHIMSKLGEGTIVQLYFPRI